MLTAINLENLTENRSTESYQRTLLAESPQIQSDIKHQIFLKLPWKNLLQFVHGKDGVSGRQNETVTFLGAFFCWHISGIVILGRVQIKFF